MDRARASEIAQAWIDASPDEQAALNRFAPLEDALTTLLPADDPAWTVETVADRPTVLVLAGDALFTLTVEGGERPGAPAPEVRCHFARTSESTLGIDLVDGPEAVYSRWRFARSDADPLELSGDEAPSDSPAPWRVRPLASLLGLRVEISLTPR